MSSVAQADVICSGSYTELKGVMDQNFKNPKEANDCVTNFINQLQNVKVVYKDNLMVLIPNNESQKVKVIKFETPSPTEKAVWGQDRILLHKKPLSKDQWHYKSGRKHLRDDFLESLQKENNLPNQSIDWSGNDDNNITFPQCEKLSCPKGERFNSITCLCEAKDCSEKKVQAEQKKCSDYLKKNENAKSYEIEFLAKYNPDTCNCEMDKNSGKYIPPRERECTEGTAEWNNKKDECEKRSDNQATYAWINCKCKKTKMFCDGKYATKLELNQAKESCESTPNNKWVKCFCEDKNGEKQCSYKEKRKMVGSFEKDKMSFNRDEGSEQHWNNEPITRHGPCDIENWLSKIGSTKKDVKHCDDYEKLVIKKNGIDNDDFKEKRFFCTKCKDGYEPNTTTTSIEGVNDDWMEDPAYTYVTSCTKVPCSSDRDGRREKECKERNTKEKNDKGIYFEWKDCKCKKEKIPDEGIPGECRNTISRRELERCQAREGEIVFSENGCHCSAPCYETIVDKDTKQVGTNDCIFDGIKVVGINPEFAETAADFGQKAVCENPEIKSDIDTQKAELMKKCQERADALPGDMTLGTSVELEVNVTSTMTCKEKVEVKTSGFADKIPGLVGGLDLKEEFTNNGKPITDPSKIDCSKDKLSYKPRDFKGTGSFKTSDLKEFECNNVLAMYNEISGRANSYIDEINGKNISDKEKIELIKQSFKANVFATANREPHGETSVDHKTLSDRRAQSMQKFYTDKVIEAAKDKGLSITAEDLKTNSRTDVMAFFGPPSKNVSANLKDQNYVACKHNKDPKKLYQCMVDLHINQEIPKLASLDQERGSHLATNFAAAVKKSEYFNKYLAQTGFSGDFKLDSEQGLASYKQFLYNQYDNWTSDSKNFLNLMKIFDLDASYSGEKENVTEAQSKLAFKCSIDIEELYRSEPIFASQEVRYGNRPGLVDSFRKDCREDYEKMIGNLMNDFKQKNASEYEDLKKEMKEDFPENWEKKLNKEVRKRAKKEWRKAKYNTRQVTKAQGGEKRWRGGSDDKNNHSETYNNVIEPGVKSGQWENDTFKHKLIGPQGDKKAPPGSLGPSQAE